MGPLIPQRTAVLEKKKKNSCHALCAIDEVGVRNLCTIERVSEQWGIIKRTMQGSTKQQAVSLYFTVDYRQMLFLLLLLLQQNSPAIVVTLCHRRPSHRLFSKIEASTHFIVIDCFNCCRAPDKITHCR